MTTVLEAAKIAQRTPETVQRWIRTGKLRAHKAGSRYVVNDEDLDELVNQDKVPLPPELSRTMTGEPMPDALAITRRQRARH